MYFENGKSTFYDNHPEFGDYKIAAAALDSENLTNRRLLFNLEIGIGKPRFQLKDKQSLGKVLLMTEPQTLSFVQLEKLYHEHKDMFLHFLLRMTYSKDTAEDLLHDSFVSMAEKFGQLKDIQKFRSWGYKICLNSFRIWYRAHKKTPVAVSNLEQFQAPTPGVSGNSFEGQKAFINILETFIKDLKEKDRSIFILASGQNLPYKAIAESLDTSERTVTRRMSIMICKLSELLRQEHLIVGKNCDLGGT